MVVFQDGVAHGETKGAWLDLTWSGHAGVCLKAFDTRDLYNTDGEMSLQEPGRSVYTTVRAFTPFSGGPGKAGHAARAEPIHAYMLTMRRDGD